MKDELNKIKNNIIEELGKIKNSEALRDLELRYLGRKGELTGILRGIVSLSKSEKKEIGRLANEVKNVIKGKISGVRKIIEGGAGDDSFVDVTLPGRKITAGHLHPITKIQNELEELFVSLGFMILDGPELESDFYNFEALNIPAYHPARDMQDTFYISPIDSAKGRPPSLKLRGAGQGTPKSEKDKSDLVMRTHTSPVQVRAMREHGAPLRCVVPGRVFRAEATDAVHEHTFDQMEGLMIGENISVANLIAVMKELINGIFKREMEVRVRPGYFPFVEPGIELDIKCTICGGKKCPACKHLGWLELLPAGMVHPNVLKHGGIDSNKYSGFAFGLGLTRMAMMWYKIDDIRLFKGGDLRFLEQF